MKQYKWETNVFYNDIKERVGGLWQHVNTKGMRWDEPLGAWTQRSVPGRCGMVYFLQNPVHCWDVTDRGIGILPMLFDVRSYIALGATVCTPEGKTDTRALLDEGGAVTRVYPGRVETVYSLEVGSLSFSLTLPFDSLAAELCIATDFPDGAARIEPYILAYVREWKFLIGGISLRLEHFAIPDGIVSRNNSVTADPPREDRGESGWLTVQGPDHSWRGDKPQMVAGGGRMLLCDRMLDGGGLFRVSLGAHPAGRYRLQLLQEEFPESVSSLDTASDYWGTMERRVALHCGLPELERRFRYSLHNSLFSRTKAGEGGTMFIHGRPDHGYGDCSKLHQSYQMYFPALLAGEYRSVKSELCAFARLMDADGGLSFQLRAGGGRHHYDGPYSNAHYIMGVYRYLCFSGDLDFLRCPTANPNMPAGFTVLDSLLASADWLLRRETPQGLMPPCGWLDAWPPAVVAQAQISLATLAAIDMLGKLLSHIGHTGAAAYQRRADDLRRSINAVFYRPESGLYAEHLFEDGSVRGKDEEDFWVHTQIWSHLASVAPDMRGLKICLAHCMGDGLRVIPDSGMCSDYIDQSTDGLADLSSGSTATWLLAAWPELNNLMALCLARGGCPDEALRILTAQMPETLYRKYGGVSPVYYAEKYLYPYHLPWLCTWAGDPTFIETVVGGLLGIQFDLGGYRVEPHLPAILQEEKISLHFIWRGKPTDITVS